MTALLATVSTSTLLAAHYAEQEGIDALIEDINKISEDSLARHPDGTPCIQPEDMPDANKLYDKWQDAFPKNRIGTVVYEREYFGQVLHHTWAEGRHGPGNSRDGYFVWRDQTGCYGRGEFYHDYDAAMNALGVEKPVGCSDWDGKVRLGRLIEHGPRGDVFKHENWYYVWGELPECWAGSTLNEARKIAGISYTPPVRATLSKADHAASKAKRGK